MTEFTGSGKTRIIAPVDFHERPRGRRRSRVPSARRCILRPLLALFIGAVAAAAWFLFTATRVQLVFEPPAERLELAGPAPRLDLGGQHLLRPGTYAEVDFNLEHEGMGYQVCCEAEVVWTAEGPDDYPLGPGFGVKFQDAPEDVVELLQLVIQEKGEDQKE